MVYGILPMLHGLDFRPSPPVDYKVPLVHLYTELAWFFLADCNDHNILALAAQARCPGAPSWVPDFSRNLSPISASVALPPLGRPDSYTSTPVQISKSGPQYAQFVTVKAKHYMEIDAVTNFVPTHFTSKERELQGRIHNASCMMRILLCILHGERIQSLEHDPYDPLQSEVANIRTYDEDNVFQIYFTHIHIGMNAKTMKRYQNAIIQSVESRQTAAQLVKVLDASEMLWAHDSISNTFVGSSYCYFVSVGHNGMWTFEEPRSDSRDACLPSSTNSRYKNEDMNDRITSNTGKIRWIGCVEENQQANVQAGDKVIGMEGVEDCLVYRESEKALVARLSTEQSKQMDYQMRRARVRGQAKRTVQIDRCGQSGGMHIT